MIERADLKRLRVPLVAALLLAVAGVAALLYAEQELSKARVQKNAATDRLKEARTRLARVAEEEQEIRNNLVRFRQLSERRMTGGEKRLEWIETLSAIRQQRRIFEVRYKLDRQRPVDYPGIKSADSVFYANRLTLDLLLLHEEDLLRFLADLAEASPSFMSLRSCVISRAEGGAPAGAQLRPRVRAECVVDMITLQAQEKAA